MSEMLQREEQIFCDALEISNGSEREKFIRDQCGDDQALFRRVHQLLRMHQTAGRILDGTTFDVASAEAETVSLPQEGEIIGNYKLLQEIGEGGMGVVFMAEQLKPVRRKVALKIIKIGMDTRRVVARFEAERQALALMEHPCITKVLDAGSTENGRPYFVMELVRGKAITQFCDEKRLSVRNRLEIFEQICQAAEHAHQKGIIHRDLKPTNIMVTSNDGQPLPKIIDFGIAKATGDRLTDKTLFTNYGEMVGTPLYMSPEQAEMNDSDVDIRSDIYSLGVLLYELLTGTTPFADLKKKSLHAIREAIRSRDPQIASTRIMNLGSTLEQAAKDRGTDSRSLHRFIKGDIDWILVKCLCRKREDRYQSAGELAREIRRHLDGEPVEAAAPTVSYRLRKFAVRHKAAVSIAAILGFILLGSTVFSSYMAVRANELAQEAKANELRANELAQEAKANELRANELAQEAKANESRAVDAEKKLAEKMKQVAEDRDQKANLARLYGIELNEAEAAAMHNQRQFERLLNRQQKNFRSQSPSRSWLGNRSSTAPENSKMYVFPARNIARRQSSYQVVEKAPVDPDLLSDSKTEVLIPGAEQVRPGAKNRQKQMKMAIKQDHDVEHLNIVVLGDDLGKARAEYLQNLCETHKKRFGEKDPVAVNAMVQYGECLANQEQWEESEKVLKQTLHLILNNKYKNGDLHTGPVRLNLAKIYVGQGKDKHAEQQLLMWKTENQLGQAPPRIRKTIETIELQLKRLKNRKSRLEKLEDKLNQSKQK